MKPRPFGRGFFLFFILFTYIYKVSSFKFHKPLLSTAVLAISAISAFASPQLVVSSMSSNEINERIEQLSTLRQSDELSENEKELIDELWQQAADIQAMNDKCASIDLTETLDEDCGYFYQTTLPVFETQFFKVTGEIRLNSNKLSSTMENKRTAIEHCYEALQIEAFHPSRTMELDGTYSPEPLSQGFEVSYNFKLQYKRDVVDDLEQRLNIWNNICGKYIKHSDGSGKLAPLFLEKIENSYNEADNIRGGLYFKVYYSDEIVIKTKTGIRAKYFLNRKELFEYRLDEDDEVAKIQLDNYGNNKIRLNIYGNKSWRDTKRFLDEDEKNGLVGKFIWGTPKKDKSVFKQNIFTQAAKKAHKDSKVSSPSYTEMETDDTHEVISSDPEKKDGGEFFFQIMGGANIGIGGSVNDELKKEYPEAWKTNSEWADTSVNLISGYVTALVSYEFSRSFAMGFGAGIAFMNAEVVKPEETGYYGEKYENVDLGQSIAPMAQAEIAFGEDWIFGIREAAVFDSDRFANYLGAFTELGNIFGLELGWNHTNNFWDAFYMGLYMKIPPRHFLEKIEKVNKKK